MNEEDPYAKRLRRFIYVFAALTMLLFLLSVAWVSYQIRDIHQSLVSLSSRQNPVVNGINGKDGADGRDGKDGLSIIGPVGVKGDAGSTTVIYNNTTTNVPIPGPQGEKGEQGQPAAPAREVELSKDEDGNIQWRYSGARAWQVLEVAP